MANTWKKVLNEKEKEFLQERVEAGFLDEPFEDDDIAQAFDADFNDALHNGNMPWDPDFAELWNEWESVLNKLGFEISLEVNVK